MYPVPERAEDAVSGVRWTMTHEYTHAHTRKCLGEVQPVIISAAFSRFFSVRMIRLLVKHGANPDSEYALAGAVAKGRYGCVCETCPWTKLDGRW